MTVSVLAAFVWACLMPKFALIAAILHAFHLSKTPRAETARRGDNTTACRDVRQAQRPESNERAVIRRTAAATMPPLRS